jgi:transcriptional regulator GlxA family with amidase domain
MMLQYIRTSTHRSLALEVANVFVYDDSHPASDTQAMSATSRLKHLESRVAQAVKFMEENLDDPVSIRSLNSTIGVSSKTLEQLFKLHLDSTPKAFYLRLRLQAARRLVLDSQLKLTEIAVRSGFNSQTHFTRSFKRHFGVAPRILRSNARA